MIRAETQTDLIRVDDGEQGIQGPQGPQGEDGNDASITVSKSGNTATVIATSGDGTQTSTTIIDGADGDDGKSAYESAVDGGYTGTETDFNTDLADVSNKAPLTIIREYSNGVLVGKVGNTVGSLVNANGSFDIVNTTWSGNTPSTAGIPLATFGTISRIGKTGNSHIDLDFHSLQLKDKEENTYFWVSDVRNADGTITDTFIGNGSTREFTLTTAAAYARTDVATIYIDGVLLDEDYYDFASARVVIFDDAPASGSVITITYQLSTQNRYATKGYSLGFRKDNSKIGLMSYAEGIDITSSAYCSHAEGYRTTASGNYSHSEGGDTKATESYAHAEGDNTTASGSRSHAEGEGTKAIGIDAHAEGLNSKAEGHWSHTEGGYTTTDTGAWYAHAEGLETKANGRHSHSQNRGTVADGMSQTVIGEYNIAQGSSNSRSNTDYAFIIGNGWDEDNPSNALTVDWDGNTHTSGRVTSAGVTSSGTISTTSTISATGNINTTGSFTMSGSKLLKVVATTKDNVSIAKATTGNGTFTVSTQSGYTPVGIVGFDMSNASSSGTGVNNCVPLQYELNGSTVSWQIRNNHSSSAVKIQMQVFILYAKTGLI